MKKYFTFAAIILIAALALGTCIEYWEDPDKPPETGLRDSPVPRYRNVTVHDPSIFRVSATGEFRIIGSFLTSAKSGDLVSWQSDSPGGAEGSFPAALKYYPQNNSNSSVQTITQQIADVMRGSAHGIQFYASDIQRMPNGKFYHYYSLTSSSTCSAIGVAIANSADGTYVTQGLIVRSNQAADSSRAPNGTSAFDSSRHPNCIDSHTFFDKSGTRLFMTYGSWSGGIFLYELDPATGLKKAGAAMNDESDGYGRRILWASRVAVEAPYVLYSPDSDYYYLFLSFGWLESAGNSQGRYQIRMFRSRNPDGPYEDAIHPITPSSPKPLETANIVNSTGDADFRNYGVKILGGYQFEHIVDEENNLRNTEGSRGFLSPGHNSAYYDSALKKYFLIFHTRFNGGWQNNAESHHVRVHEMFINEHGWLSAAPFRHDGGTVRVFNEKQLEGKWKILNHGRSINQGTDSLSRSQNYTFNADGTISGAGDGTWALKEDRKTALITLGGTAYSGLFLRCYDEFHNVWVYAFTAMSNDGIALWGSTPGITTDLNIGQEEAE